MKTHELAKALRELSQLLRRSPNADLADLQITPRHASGAKPEGAELGLSALVSLSMIDKRQWLGLIQEYGFPIEVRPRDASRDILGKLLRYLERNSLARERLRRGAQRKASQASPELMRALDFLLRTGSQERDTDH